MRRLSPLLALALVAGCGFRTHPWDPPDAVTPPPIDGGGPPVDLGFVGSDCDYLFATTADADRGRSTLCTSTLPIPAFEMPVEDARPGSSTSMCWRVTTADPGAGWDVDDRLYGARGTIGAWSSHVTFEGRVYNGDILYKKVIEVVSPARPAPMTEPSDLVAVTAGAPYDYGVVSGVTMQDATYPGVGRTLARAGDQVAWLRDAGGVFRLVVRSYPAVERTVIVPGIDGAAMPLLASSARAHGAVTPIAIASDTSMLVYAVPPHPGMPVLAGTAALPTAIRSIAVVVSDDGMHATVVALTADGITAWRPPAAPAALDVGGRATGLVPTPNGAAVVRADGVLVELTMPGTVLTVSPEAVFPDAARVGTPLVSNAVFLLGTDGIAVRTRFASAAVLDGGPTFMPATAAFDAGIDAAAVDTDLVVGVDRSMYVLSYGGPRVCD